MVPKPAFLKRFVEQAADGLDSRQSVLFLLLWLTAFAVPISIAAAQILLAAASLYWAVQVGLNRRWQVARLPFLWPLLACLFTTLLAVLVSPDLKASASSLKKFWFFLIPFLAVEALRSERQREWLLRALFIAGSASALVAFWQYPESQPLHRISGFLGHWQTFSGQQMMLLAMLASLLLFYARTYWFYGACLLLTACGLLLSETRGAWLGAAVALALLAFLKDKRLLAALGILLLTGYFLMPANLQARVLSIFGTQEESNAARINMWATGLNMIRAHPWLGVGPNQITALAYQYGGNPRYEPRFFTHLHNNFLQFAAERGLPGLAAWIWLIARFYWDVGGSLSARRGSGPRLAYAVGWGVVAALTAVMVAGMVEYNLGDSEVLMLLLFLLSCAYSSNSLKPEESTQPDRMVFQHPRYFLGNQ